MWEDLATILAHDWHVIALDLRGHGDSDWSSTGDYHALSYLADLAAFLRDVAGWPARVVGHSMGARLTLQLMACLPEAVCALVAIEGLGTAEATTETDERMREWIADRAGRAARGPVEQSGDWLRARIVAERRSKTHTDCEGPIARQMADRKKGLTARQAEAFVHGNMRCNEGGWVWKFDPLARWQASHEVVEAQAIYWSAITGPVLHVYGEESWAYPPARAALDAFGDSRLAVVPGGGHWVHLNQSQRVAAEITGFFNAVQERK